MITGDFPGEKTPPDSANCNHVISHPDAICVDDNV